MPRVSRYFEPEGIYHIIVRGNKKEAIYRREQDYLFFLNLFHKKWEEHPLKLYAFALMGNHFHLLVEAFEEPLATFFQPFLTSYAIYFNKTYDQIGHVFQDRYKSFLVGTEKYLKEVFRYINLNPIRAGLVNNLSEYKWCSHYYFLHPEEAPIFLDTFLFDLFGRNQKEREKYYTLYLEELYGELDPENIGPEESITLFNLNYLAREICQEYGISLNDLKNGKRNFNLVTAQMEFTQRAKDQFGIHYTDIAKYLGKSYAGLIKNLEQVRK